MLTGRRGGRSAALGEIECGANFSFDIRPTVATASPATPELAGQV